MSEPNSPEKVNEIILSLLDHLEAMVAYWDGDQRCVFANHAYLHWFGRSREQMVGIALKDLLGPLYAKNLPHIEAVYRGEIQVFERQIPTPSGKVRESLATYTPHIVDGSVRGFFVHVADVSPLKALERELREAKEAAERMASHDFLTGLPNRVLLHDRIEQAFTLARRTQKMVAGISLDLDDFKQINDLFGHAAGDALLVAVASRARQSVRDIDTVTRIGGDEFFLLFPEVDSHAQMELIASRILLAVRAPLQLDNACVRPSCSLGISIGPPGNRSPQALIDDSDKALYEAKAKGKSRFAFSRGFGAAA